MLDWKIPLILISFLILVLIYFFNLKENFSSYDQFDYQSVPSYKINANPVKPYGPSDISGVSSNPELINSNKKLHNPQVDIFTKSVDNEQLRNKFERTYLLDPTGELAQYDITNNKISAGCCPAQYSPPFKIVSDEEKDLLSKGNYVPNGYSGMNMESGPACLCITKTQADFVNKRGNNA